VANAKSDEHSWSNWRPFHHERYPVHVTLRVVSAVGTNDTEDARIHVNTNLRLVFLTRLAAQIRVSSLRLELRPTAHNPCPTWRPPLRRTVRAKATPRSRERISRRSGHESMNQAGREATWAIGPPALGAA
jgi:hypothetical protein